MKHEFAKRLAKGVLGIAAAGVFAAGVGSASAEELKVYTAIEADDLKRYAEEFNKQYPDIEIKWVRDSTGIVTAKLLAEKQNPQADIVWGLAATSLMLLKNEGMTHAYMPKGADKLDKRFIDTANPPHWTGMDAWVAAICVNTIEAEKNGLPMPTSWKDLTKPIYKGEVQIASPHSSGTSYTTLATIVQLFGEDEGFKFLQALHKNINQYTKSGSAPIKAAARGETTIGITFLHDVVTQVIKGMPIKAVAPCEGTGFEIGSMSIIKGARNLANAKKWVDWALSPDAQKLMPQAKAYQVPSNAGVAPPPEAPKIEQIKLIDYNFKLYGSSAERKRLLSKWDNEVKALPQ